MYDQVTKKKQEKKIHKSSVCTMSEGPMTRILNRKDIASSSPRENNNDDKALTGKKQKI